MFSFFLFELRRLVREPRLLIFTVFMPVISYVVFTGVGDMSGSTEGVSLATAMTVGVAGYGAMTGVLSVGGGVSNERVSGWLRQLRLTPLPPMKVVVVKGVLATLIAIPSVLAVCLTGHLQHHVDLPAGRWLAVVAVLWLGTIPFALLGLAIGYSLPPQIAQPASFLTFFMLSIVGGLLVPVAVLPRWLRHIAVALPSNRYAELGWRAAGGHLPTMMGGAVLAGWTLLFAVLAAAAYRRSAGTR
ncbi:ABC transporter permease [Rugosimonospora acidiphila]|uniref:ABC transporter permease n=1 Tax=Rugosimonospora acidiphila TaxID=556531 RepID=A0ABP9RZA4_9ACTN